MSFQKIIEQFRERKGIRNLSQVDGKYRLVVDGGLIIQCFAAARSVYLYSELDSLPEKDQELHDLLDNLLKRALATIQGQRPGLSIDKETGRLALCLKMPEPQLDLEKFENAIAEFATNFEFYYSQAQKFKGSGGPRGNGTPAPMIMP